MEKYGTSDIKEQQAAELKKLNDKIAEAELEKKSSEGDPAEIEALRDRKAQLESALEDQAEQ